MKPHKYQGFTCSTCHAFTWDAVLPDFAKSPNFSTVVISNSDQINPVNNTIFRERFKRACQKSHHLHYLKMFQKKNSKMK